MALNDYQENQFLPAPLRVWLKAPNKVQVYRSYDYLRIFSGYDLMAILNNKFASDVASGYTPANVSNLMSGIAPRLQEILVNKIVKKVDYIGYKECKGINDKVSKEYLTTKLKKAFNNATRTGRDLSVLYTKEENNKKQITIQNVECFRHKLIFDDEEIVEANILLNQIKLLENSYFNIFERRFYKDGKPYKEYTLQKMVWSNNNYDSTQLVDYNKEETEYLINSIADEGIREQIKQYKFYKPVELPFDDLGCYHIDNTTYNSKFPNSNIPESRFVNVQDKIMEIENSITFKEIDKNMGRGRAVIPSSFNFNKGLAVGGNKNNLAALNAFDNPMDSTYFIKYQTGDMNNATPQAMQFDIRADQWRASLDGEIADLCAAFGLTVLDYDPRLLQAGQRTDDEINSMVDVSAETVSTLRTINEYQINLMLNSIAKYLDYKTPITIKWDLTSIMNPTKNQTLIGMMLQNGTISRKKAIQQSHPDYTDEEVEEELKEIESERGLAEANAIF